MAKTFVKVEPLSQEDLKKLHETKPPTYKRKLKLNLPLYSMAHLDVLMIRADSEPYEADFSVAIPGKPDSKPTVIRVTNLDDGEQGLLILNTIMLSSLGRAVGPLTGRFFRFISGGVPEGKQYRRIECEELECVNEDESPHTH